MIRKQAGGDYDVVSGTRYRGGGGIYGWDMFRKFTSRVAHFLATVMFSPGISDLTGSFRLYKKSVLDDVMPRVKSHGTHCGPLTKAYAALSRTILLARAGYTFQMEVIVRAKQRGYTVESVSLRRSV